MVFVTLVAVMAIVLGFIAYSKSNFKMFHYCETLLQSLIENQQINAIMFIILLERYWSRYGIVL